MMFDQRRLERPDPAPFDFLVVGIHPAEESQKLVLCVQRQQECVQCHLGTTNLLFDERLVRLNCRLSILLAQAEINGVNHLRPGLQFFLTDWKSQPGAIQLQFINCELWYMELAGS